MGGSVNSLRLKLLAEPALRLAHEMLLFPSEELSTFPGQVQSGPGTDKAAEAARAEAPSAFALNEPVTNSN